MHIDLKRVLHNETSKSSMIHTLEHTLTHLLPWHLVELAGLTGGATIFVTATIGGAYLIRRLRNPIT